MGEKKYYLHRISHEKDIAYSLLDKGYLSMGWSKYSRTEIMNAARKIGDSDFKEICKNESKSRWSMWYFAQMQKGDIVLVPQDGGLFSVYEVQDQAKSICEYSGQIDDIKGKFKHVDIIWKDGFLHDADMDDKDSLIDLGFLMPVQAIIKGAERSSVPAALVSRMKIRSTNADITDINRFIDQAINAYKAGKPISLYNEAVKKLAKVLLDSITDTLNPDKFERLIKWYMEKCGADNVRIPAKNERTKHDSADADVVAVFGKLNHIVYIQAKFHKGKTNDWAVKQIAGYKEQNSENGDYGCSYAAWVISTAEQFSEEAQTNAAENNVRLISGREFSRMLIDVGLLNLSDAFN